MIFVVPIGWMLFFFCLERLRDIFGPDRLSDFFVPRGCMIFFSLSETLHVFLSPS